ncbi:MAG: hypothetical protein E6G77_07690 [Alphaproteobacteria bacterium]|nr:MAG: hypothetical protein E6G77_07690 [Alphaproteobacteria bacterium]
MHAFHGEHELRPHRAFDLQECRLHRRNIRAGRACCRDYRNARAASFRARQLRFGIGHPYRGGGQALTGLLGGEVQVLFSTLVQILPQVRDGRVKGLAVTSERRSPLAPDLPTMVESGFDQFITTSVNVIVAPPWTPLTIRRQINQAAAAALASTEVQQAFATLGAEARPASPEEVASYLAEAQQRWSRLIERARISID